MVEVFNELYVISKHTGPTFWSTYDESVSDIAWQALTSLDHYQHGKLRGSLYSYFHQRMRGIRLFRTHPYVYSLIGYGSPLGSPSRTKPLLAHCSKGDPHPPYLPGGLRGHPP
jgi:hypothetical protein